MRRAGLAQAPFLTLATMQVMVLVMVLDPAPATAYEFRTLGALSGMATVAPGSGDVTNGELGLRLRAELLGIKGTVDLKADFWGRLGLEGNPSVQELRELWVKVRNLGGRVDLTVGRFHTPGGFWLIADGARLDLRYTEWLTHTIYGGLRAFTTDRANADLAIADPVLLPLAGTSLSFRHSIFDLALTFTWARDSLNLQSTWDAASGLRRERHVEDELFLDAQLLALPASTVTVAAGLSFGTRYDVQFHTGEMTLLPATIGVATLGALNAWAMAEWRPTKRLRLAYSGNFERIRLIQSQLLATKADGTPVQAAPGDFLDNGIRASLLVWKAMRADVTYRLRYRGNTDLEHHVVAGLRGDQILGDAGLFASVGFDVLALGSPRADVISAGQTTSIRVLYSGGLSYLKPWLDARVGVLFTDGIGSGLLFSQTTAGATAGVNPSTQLFPYVLESNRVAFVRVFGVWHGLFGGIDVEENLDSVQLRMLAQVGISR